MGKLKDSLAGKTGRTVTLTSGEISYLKELNYMAQQALEQLQQRQAAAFLHYVAVNRFDYAPVCDLSFNLDLTKSQDNLEIINLSK